MSEFGGDAASFLAKFGFVLVLVYASLRGLRVFTPRQQDSGTGSAQIHILETRHLSSTRTLYLVRAGSKVLLLGGTDRQITLLSEIDEDEWKIEDGE